MAKEIERKVPDGLDKAVSILVAVLGIGSIILLPAYSIWICAGLLVLAIFYGITRAVNARKGG